MATSVPSQGIHTYMDHQAATLTPPNIIWRIKHWFSVGPGAYIVIAAIVIALGGPMLGSTMKSLINSAVTVAVLPAVVVVLILAIGARDPGCWRRYSLPQLYARHPQLYEEIAWAPLAVRAHGLTNEGPEPEAEFEVAVLEWRGKTYGTVLFMVWGRAGHPCEDVVQVYSQDNRPVQFGDAYAVAAPA